MKVVDKTYLTRSGRDIRDCKMEGTFEINISENNEKVAEKRIKEWEKSKADTIRMASQFYAKSKTLIKK